jgi:nucleotide-binding universal stress UspA family protein
MKNILVPVDFSAETDRVISMAATLASATKAHLWIVHVAAPDPDFVGFDAGPTYVREQRAEILRQEHVQIQELAASMKQQGLACEGLLVQGPTTDTLLEEIDRLQADLVIMGSHGKSGLFKAFVGSVSEQVLRESRVPVMIVPATGRS